MTPGKAIRVQCVACVGSFKDVGVCGGHGKNPLYDYCPFYPYRLGRGRPSVKTIRKFCLQCMNKTSAMILDCPTVSCPVYEFRLGKNPAYSGRAGNASRLPQKNPQKGGTGKAFKSQDALLFF